MPRGASALGFSQSESKDTKLYSKEELRDRMATLLGGRIAEELFCDDVTTGASDDIEKLTKLCYQFISVFGMDKSVGLMHCNWKDKQISEDLRQRIDLAVSKEIDNAYIRARAFMIKEKGKIETLAEELLEKETVVKADLDRLWT